jgi:2-dehydropantoate 2-reductase
VFPKALAPPVLGLSLDTPSRHAYNRAFCSVVGEYSVNIAVIGVGGVGGYFGGRLCQPLQSRGDKVYFVARGDHLAEIRRNGLLLRTADHGDLVCRPTLATDNFRDLPDIDVCLLCVKSYDLQPALEALSPRITGRTLILPLLNGVDIYERIRQIVGTGTVFPASVYVGTHIEAPGKVAQQGGACRILLGRDPATPDSVPSELLSVLEQAGIAHEWFDDVYPEIWMKYLFIAAFGLVTAACDKTLGQVMEARHLSDYVRSIMNEICAIASQQGIGLPENAVSESFRKGYGFPYETKTSFQRDVEKADKPDERDLFGGTILRLGEVLGMPTPATLEVCGMLDLRKPEYSIHGRS